MSLLDGIGKKIAQTSQNTAQKAKNMAETVKINGMISEEGKRIDNAFLQIGKTYYEVYGENPDQMFIGLLEEINEARERIALYEDQIRQIKGVTNCYRCGGEVAYNAPFCSGCGSPMNTAPMISSNEGGCNVCATPIKSGAVFCTGCGNKVEQQEEFEQLQETPLVSEESQPLNYVEASLSSCSGCGNNLAEGAVFCLNCGQKVGSDESAI